MRFPLALTSKIATYIIGKKLRGTKKFATVLQLEPLHTCNLTCTGCGRIREYSTSPQGRDVPGRLPRRGHRVRRADGVHLRRRTADLPADRGAFQHGLLNDQGRVVYLCTNAMFMRRKMRAYMAREFGRSPQTVEDQARRVAADRRDDRKGGRRGPQGSQGRRRAGHGPAPVLFLERAPRRPGVHARPHRRARGRLQGVHPGHEDGQVARLQRRHEHHGLQGNRHDRDRGPVRFPERHRHRRPHDQPRLRVRRRQGRHDQAPEPPAGGLLPDPRGHPREVQGPDRVDERYPVLGTPIYHEFLVGKRELECSAWAIPTRNIAGWRGPCYFMAGAGHFPTYEGMLRTSIGASSAWSPARARRATRVATTA